jgi:hypothetical protein
MEQKKSVLKMFLSVGIGIAAVWLLTSVVWGNGLYQVAISIIIGIVVGLIIDDIKNAVAVFRDMKSMTALITGLFDSKWIKLLKTSIESVKKMPLYRKSFCIKVMVASIAFCLGVVYTESVWLILGIFAYIAVVVVVPYFETFESYARLKTTHRIWNNTDRDPYFYENVKKLNFFHIEKKLFVLGLAYVLNGLLGLIGIVLGLCVLIISVALTILFIPVWIINLFFANGRTLLISSSILLGGFVVAYVNPFYLGFIAGFSFCAIGLIFHHFIKQVNPFFLVRNGGFASQVWDLLVFDTEDPLC